MVLRSPHQDDTAAPDDSTSRADGTTVATRAVTVRDSPFLFLRRHISWPIAIANVAVFLLAWEAFARAGYINPLFLPAPSQIFGEVLAAIDAGTLQPAIMASLRNFTIGMALGCLFGIPLGLLMGVSRIVDTVLAPYVWGFASLPKVAMVPLLILFLGFSNAATITLVFLSAFFPIVIGVMAGPKTVEKSLLSAGRVFGANKGELYLQIILPYTVPFIIAAINQGLTRGLVGLVVAEMFGGNRGLGFLIIKAGQSFNSGLLYGVLLCLVMISLSFLHGVRWIEGRVAPWRRNSLSS